jgi:hypothetical protein
MADTKFVNTYSGRSGSSAALVSPKAKRQIVQKGGKEFGTNRQISAAGTKFGETSEKMGTEFTTVRSGRKSAKTYGKSGKFASKHKPIAPNKKGK